MVNASAGKPLPPSTITHAAWLEIDQFSALGLSELKSRWLLDVWEDVCSSRDGGAQISAACGINLLDIHPRSSCMTAMQTWALTANINTKAQTMPIIEHHGKPEVRQWQEINYRPENLRT